MALEKCDECGGQVSTEARVCPHCGGIRSWVEERHRERDSLWVWWEYQIIRGDWLDLEARLKSQGLDGWEAVSIVTSRSDDDEVLEMYQVLLKRPKFAKPSTS